MPGQAQVARGCGSLVLEPGSHVGNSGGAQEGARLGLDLKPAKESAGQHTHQTILGPWKRQRYPANDRSRALPLRGEAASIWAGSGARWQVGQDGFVNISISHPESLLERFFFFFLAS